MQTNLQVAKPVIDRVNLRMVTLRSAEVRSSIDPLDVGAELSVSFKYRTRYERPANRPDNVYTFVGLRLVARAGEQEDVDSSEPVLELEAEYLLVYDLPDAGQFDKDALHHFAELNGTYNAWPYWRELVQTVSGRVGLASIVVPVFRAPIRKLAGDDAEQLSLEPVTGADG